LSSDYRDPKFKKWLDQLQQESWQLELVISGFAIYGLIMAYEPLYLMIKVAENEQKVVDLILSIIGLISCSILLFNLILHVVLRGLWIGALGLRYVSGDIDYEKLKYSEKFTNHLKKRIGSFDKYIATLEDYCSVLFALSFLLIFYVLSLILGILTILGITIFLIDNEAWGGVVQGFGIVLVLFVLLGMILTLVDFIGQGILKKNKTISKIYFPFYWLFSILTLSFLYRPLVYNFLDNRFGKRLIFLLIPAYAIILSLISMEYRDSNYLKKDQWSSSFYADYRNYEDQLQEKDKFIRIAAIPSKVITDSFLKIFLVHTENIEDQIYSFYPEMRPKEDRRGLGMSGSMTGEDQYYGQGRKMTRKFLSRLNELYSVSIDSSQMNSDFIITVNDKNKLGFETYVNISELEAGKHLLKINRKKIKDNDTIRVRVVTIPFWHFK
jgi:hypothetical protein